MNFYAFHLHFISLSCLFGYLFISFTPLLPSVASLASPLSLSLSLFLVISTFAYLSVSFLSFSYALRLSLWLFHPSPTLSTSSTPSPFHGSTAVDRVVAVRTRQLADHEGSVRPPLPPSQAIPLLARSSALWPLSLSSSYSSSSTFSLSLSLSLSVSLLLSLLALFSPSIPRASSSRARPTFVPPSSTARSTPQVDTARYRSDGQIAPRHRWSSALRDLPSVTDGTPQRNGPSADQEVATTHRLIGGQFTHSLPRFYS